MAEIKDQEKEVLGWLDFLLRVLSFSLFVSDCIHTLPISKGTVVLHSHQSMCNILIMLHYVEFVVCVLCKGNTTKCTTALTLIQISALETQLQASSLPLKVAQTRLEGRTERRGQDLVRDAAQDGLAAEVTQLTQSRTLLRQQLALALYVVANVIADSQWKNEKIF